MSRARRRPRDAVHGARLTIATRAIVQARMSSTRFPGKVLAPFRGRPVLSHIVERLAGVIEGTVVATSTEPSDDPIAAYGHSLGVPVFRGPLHDVVGRFQRCLDAYPCEWFLRVCADSPLLEPGLVTRMLQQATPGVDLVTNTFPRTFPPGLSLELLRTATFMELDVAALSADQREHITRVYYDQPHRFRIVNVTADERQPSSVHLAIDTVEDLLALESMAGVTDP